MLRRSLLLLLLLCPLSLQAKQLVCSPKGPQKYWINEIRLNTDTKKVTIDIGPYRAQKRTETVDLLLQEPTQYAFNAPTGEEHQFNAFRLFYPVDEWRLIHVGLTDLNGVPIMRAGGGDSTAFKCSATTK